MKNFELLMLQIESINVCSDYQRKTDMARVKRNNSNFVEACAKVISISRRKDGTYWAYDGMHTLEIYRLQGFKEVPCKVVHGDSESESRWFYLMNGPGVVKARPEERHIAQLNFNDPLALEADKLLKQYGLTIAKGGGRIGGTRAIASIKQFLKSDRPRLVRAMDMIDRLWSEQPDAWTQIMVRGAWETAGTGLIDSVEERLGRRKVTPTMILEVASGMQSATGTHGGGSAYIKKAYFKLARIKE